MRITSAPNCAKVIPPNGAATKADASTTRMPARIESFDMVVAIRSNVGASQRPFEQALRNHLQCQRLFGTLEDRQHAGVHKITADRRLFRIAHAAMDL